MSLRKRLSLRAFFIAKKKGDFYMGGIEKRGKDKYRLTVSSGFKSDGTRKYIRKTVQAKSEREARKKLALFVAEVESNNITADSNMKFRNFVDIWDKNYAETNLEVKTYVRYKDLLRINILPAIGDMKLTDIKPVTLLDLYKSLSKDGARKDGKPGGYSAKTIQHIHRLISSVYNKAIEWQIIGINPALHIKPPKVVKKEVEFYSVEEVRILIEALEKEHIRPKTMTMLAVYTGMRRSEILALKWEDIDFEKKVIYVNKAAIYASGYGRVNKDTKTVRTNRIIAMSETMCELLKKYKEWQDEIRNFLLNKWEGSDFVFTNDFGGTLHPDSISVWFRRFIKRNNLKYITFHGLRHTAATLLLNSGTDVETVSRILGHSSSNVTSQIYLHSANAVRAEAMDRLDKAINNNFNR